MAILAVFILAYNSFFKPLKNVLKDSRMAKLEMGNYHMGSFIPTSQLDSQLALIICVTKT